MHCFSIMNNELSNCFQQVFFSNELLTYLKKQNKNAYINTFREKKWRFCMNIKKGYFT